MENMSNFRWKRCLLTFSKNEYFAEEFLKLLCFGKPKFIFLKLVVSEEIGIFYKTF